MRLLAAVAAAVLAVVLPAQERHACARLDDGTQCEGRVVAMDDRWLKLLVDGRVRTFDARKVREVRFVQPAIAAPAQAEAGAAATSHDAAGREDAHTNPASAPLGDASEAEPPVPASPLVETRPPATAHPGPSVWTEEPAVAPAAGHRTLLQERLAQVDARYPWLHPTLPVQWGSYAVLLWVLCTFAIRASAGICGAEAAPAGRSAAIAVGYLAAAAAQVAYAPSDDFARTTMLLANPAVALFVLRRAYGLTRIGATLAFAVQLGFAALGFGALELVESTLGAVAPR
jgi:hypothetical protein